MPERHPGWVDGIDASEARLATGLLVSSAAGVGDQLDPLRVRTGIRDAPNHPGLVVLGTNKVTVNPFQAVIADSARPSAGSHLVTLDEAKELPVSAADPQYPRIDLVVAVVDPEVVPGFQVIVVEGDPAATPQPPVVSQSASLELAAITVPPSGKGAPTMADRRRFTTALGGILPAPSAADLPAGAPDGQFAFQLDTSTLMVHQQGGWVVYRPPAVQEPWIPIVPMNNWKLGYGSIAPAAYQRSADGWVRMRGMIRQDKDSKGEYHPELQICTLPDGYRPKADLVFGVMTGAGSIGPLQVTADGRIVHAIAGTATLSSTWTSLSGVAFTTY